ncbi:hypothetical protein F183_A05530 [Bryobacterales bacterium F-183]|nr:hypothetical protein F183_A05530 [Bryobacterales bacterium F-183]
MAAFRFGDGFALDTERRRLTRGELVLQVPARALDVLAILIAERQRTVTKEELMSRVWQGVAVTENSLNQCISSLRKLLGDSRQEPKYIATIPNLGYRFVGEVAEEPVGEVQGRSGLPRVFAVLLVIFIGGVGLWRISPGEPSIRVAAFVNEVGKEEDEWLSASLAELTAARLGLPAPDWWEEAASGSDSKDRVTGSYRVDAAAGQVTIRMQLPGARSAREWTGAVGDFATGVQKLLPAKVSGRADRFAAYRSGHWSAAVRPLREALAVSPEDREVRVALGVTLYQLGRWREAVALLEGRPEAAGFVSAAKGDWKGAVQQLGAAWARRPEDPQAGLDLAEAQFQARDGEAARSTLAAVSRLWPQAAQDPRWLLASARVEGHFQKMKPVEEFARKAVGEAERQRRTDSMAGKAALLAAGAMMNQGREGEAEVWRAKARRIYRDAGDLLCLAAGARVEGNAALGKRRPEEAAAAYRQTLRLTRLAGNDRERAHALNGLGAVLLASGSYSAAEQVYREGMRMDVHGLGLARTGWYTGVTEALLGQRRFDEAHRAAGESLRIAQEDQDREGVAHAYANLAHALASSRRTAEAGPMFAKAVDLFSALQNPALLSQTLERGRSLGLEVALAAAGPEATSRGSGGGKE